MCELIFKIFEKLLRFTYLFEQCFMFLRKNDLDHLRDCSCKIHRQILLERIVKYFLRRELDILFSFCNKHFRSYILSTPPPILKRLKDIPITLQL